MKRFRSFIAGKESLLKRLFIHVAAGAAMALCWSGTAMASGEIAIDAAHFPDANFRNYISSNFDTSDPKDNKLSTDEINAVKHVDPGSKVASLGGLKYFTAMTSIAIHDNKNITSVDLEGFAELEWFNIDFNRALTSVHVKGCDSLRWFSMNSNKDSTLVVSGCPALKSIGTNSSSSIDIRDCPALEDLTCGDVEELKLGNSPVLKTLYCSSGELTSLDLSGCPALEKLHCYDNKLTSLDLSGCPALETLHCYDNKLTSLDISPCSKLEANYFNQAYYARKDEDDDTMEDISGDYPFIFDGSITLVTSKGTFEPETASKESSESETTPKEPSDPETTPKEQPAPVTVSTEQPAPATISKQPSLNKLKAAKKGKIKVSWKKIKKTKKTKAVWKKIKKIEVQYSTDPSFQTGVMTKTAGKAKGSLTIKKLQKGTVYYVRIRYVDGAGGHSEWSKVRKVMTKKK